MNIAYVTKAHWGDNSPGLIFSYYQARSIADNNHEISLIMQPSKRPDDNKNDLNKINPIDLKLLSNSLGPFKANEIFYRRANALILSGDYDTVLTRDPGYLPYLVRLKKRGKKIYYQSHNFYMDFSRHEYIQSVNRKKFNKYENKYLNSLDGMMTLNTPQKELYEKYVDIPVTVCHPGLNKFSSKSKFENKEVVYCGSFQPLKGIETILDIYKNKSCNFKLTLIGGRNEQELSYAKNLIGEKNIKNIKLKGWVFYKDLENIISKASIGLMLLPDNFYNKYLTAPNKLFDYISMGMPVICSDLPSIRDLIPSEHPGVVFVPSEDKIKCNEEIEKLLTDEGHYKRLQQSNIMLSKNLLWKKQTETLIKAMIK
tara:strand:- start:2663 stop:3772 length:1110 start_codon:yes stop_codon:yes gene_type:complete